MARLHEYQGKALLKEHKIPVPRGGVARTPEEAAEIAQEIDGEVLLISPLAPDWLDNMRIVAQTFADVLGEEK